ncbi:AAA family ATPase [Paraflavisolibacter sp. H34]|uniref:AAA family ATPase n=1 Tax=Huijunlia imazamoxiresistens TaxID=3127457 RepID=UPI00301610A7
MQIEKLTIQNFRNIGPKTSFLFDPQFTVIIGINGKGKSTLLHALRIACGTYLLAITEVPKRHIDPDEIRLERFGTHSSPQTPVIVEAEGYFPEYPDKVVWRRQIPEGKSRTTSNEEDVGRVRNIGREKYLEVTRKGNDTLALPVIAFFGTSRAHGAGRNRGTRVVRQIFKEGYHNWEEMKSSTYQYDSWLSSFDALLLDKKEDPQVREGFYAALKRANPYIEDVQFVGGELWLRVKIEEYTSDFLPLHLHSDGVIMLTEMVAELAYRCSILNGYLGARAVEETRGVVLIDELDLHLHPNWQRHVVQDLKNAFPRIQFMATTHSPFIVQSLNSNELINLDLGTDVSPKELSLEVVAEEVMNVKSPFSDENAAKEQLSMDYFQLLEEAVNSPDKAAYIDRLETFENAIDDAGLRAFLKSTRIAKNIL